MSDIAGIILAAGKGTRMKSTLPKVLHEVCGVPMVALVGRAMRAAGVERPIVVHSSAEVCAALGDSFDFALQAQQLGTGDAVRAALSLLEGFEGRVLIAPGDTPLLTSDVFSRLLEASGDCALAACRLTNPAGYGRVITAGGGSAVRIVEDSDTSGSEKAVSLVNASVYSLEASMLRRFLPCLGARNVQGELYLTDIISMIANEGGRCTVVEIEDADILRGVNDRWQLAEADEILRVRILRGHAENGVTIRDIRNTRIGADVQLSQDCVVEPFTILEGSTRVGAKSVVGPYSRITDSAIGDDCTVLFSHVNRVVIGNRCRVGPYANLRPHSTLADDVKIGNFVELKNAQVGEASSLSHLSYVGDATVGKDSNIGAGTITCNYDGFNKHTTIIGDGVFIGSNTTLIAPVNIGDNAMTAAGSTVSEDVPDDSLAVGRSRQENKIGWVKKWRQRNQKS